MLTLRSDYLYHIRVLKHFLPLGKFSGDKLFLTFHRFFVSLRCICAHAHWHMHVWILLLIVILKKCHTCMYFRWEPKLFCKKKGRNHESSSLLRLSVNQITELSINAFLSPFRLHTGAFLAISYNKVYHSDGPLKCKLS